jgi:hypothetical protein
MLEFSSDQTVKIIKSPLGNGDLLVNRELHLIKRVINMINYAPVIGGANPANMVGPMVKGSAI